MDIYVNEPTFGFTRWCGESSQRYGYLLSNIFCAFAACILMSVIVQTECAIPRFQEIGKYSVQTR